MLTGPQTKQHVYYSGYTWAQLKTLVTMMIECCDQPLPHHSAVFEKYKDRRYRGASMMVQRALDAGFTLPHHSVPVRASRVRAGDDGSGRPAYANGLLVRTEG